MYQFVYILSFLPLRFLYIVSDILGFLLYHCVRYRRKIVRKNLVKSFPEKSLDEIKSIENGFYRFFCDYIVETVKLASMSEAEMKRRMRFENMELVEKAAREGRSVAFYLGHYCNWEWVSSMPINFRETDFVFGQVYHPLRNKAFDKMMLKIRGRFGAMSIPKNDILRVLVKWRKKGQKNMVGYISDQIPKMDNIHHWTKFLNQDTAVFTGAERLSKIMGDVVLYGDIHRKRRGVYVMRFQLISEDGSKEPQFAITEKYFHLMEATIRRAPQYWLWSHNRWKRTLQEYDSTFSEKERDRRLHRI